MTISPLAPATFPAMPDISGVTLSTAASGMKYTGRDDMLLMQLGGSGSIAAVFTKSDTAAAPVAWCRRQLGAGCGARAILVNAGNANAFTGDGGMAAVARAWEASSNPFRTCQLRSPFSISSFSMLPSAPKMVS